MMMDSPNQQQCSIARVSHHSKGFNDENHASCVHHPADRDDLGLHIMSVIVLQ